MTDYIVSNENIRIMLALYNQFSKVVSEMLTASDDEIEFNLVSIACAILMKMGYNVEIDENKNITAQK